MQHHKPIVSTNEGAVPNMVLDSENGFICLRQNASSLSYALERLIVDEALRNTMGEEGSRIYQKKFTLQCFEHRFTEILREMNG